MASDCESLRKTSAKSFSIDNGGFTAQVTRDKKSLVFFSVPYDEGWSASVNGKKVEIERVNCGFMAVAVDAGESQIRFDYRNTFLDAGIAVTLGAVFILVLYIIICSVCLKNHSGVTEYPEGEKLLEQWKADDIIAAVSAYSSERSESILDGLDDEYLPVQNNELSGGFKINKDALNLEDDDEA